MKHKSKGILYKTVILYLDLTAFFLRLLDDKSRVFFYITFINYIVFFLDKWSFCIGFVVITLGCVRLTHNFSVLTKWLRYLFIKAIVLAE